MFPRSVRSVGPVGFQPSSSLVFSLEDGRVLPAKNPKKPKCSWAFSGEIEITGIFSPRPIAVARSPGTLDVVGGNVGDAVVLKVDVEHRNEVRANHSATHLLHAALRNTLGKHVSQKGSLVAADRFRFDFSHPKALTAQETLPCGARLISADLRGRYVNALFALTGRPGPGGPPVGKVVKPDSRS